MARAYAVTPLPCAAACAPFKSSPATYATCCKQHAATTAPKPVAAKPVSNIIKSTRPKPPSTGALQQGQMTFYDRIGPEKLLPGNGPLDLFKAKPQPRYPPPQNITNYNYNYTAPPTPSGDSCGTVPMECHNHGDRNEGERPQTDASYEYGGTFLIPQANDQLTLEFQGLAHSDGNDRSGYKVAFNEGKSGVFMWKQSPDGYGQPIPPNGGGNSNYQARIGSRVNVTIRKQDIGPPSSPIGVEINAFADNQLVGRWRDMNNQPFKGISPYTGVRPSYRVGYRNDGLLGCNSLMYKSLQNLSA